MGCCTGTLGGTVPAGCGSLSPSLRPASSPGRTRGLQRGCGDGFPVLSRALGTAAGPGLWQPSHSMAALVPKQHQASLPGIPGKAALWGRGPLGRPRRASFPPERCRKEPAESHNVCGAADGGDLSGQRGSKRGSTGVLQSICGPSVSGLRKVTGSWWRPYSSLLEAPNKLQQIKMLLAGLHQRQPAQGRVSPGGGPGQGVAVTCPRQPRRQQLALSCLWAGSCFWEMAAVLLHGQDGAGRDRARLARRDGGTYRDTGTQLGRHRPGPCPVVPG